MPKYIVSWIGNQSARGKQGVSQGCEQVHMSHAVLSELVTKLFEESSSVK
jgi:hypothetical protein